MKPLSLLLVGSIAANTVLVALLIAGSIGGKTATSSVSPSAPPIIATTTLEAAAGLPAWSDLRPDDLPGLADRLRAAGAPASVIRALLADRVRMQFDAQRADINRNAPSRRFWEKTAPDPQTAAALAQLDKEEKQALAAVLGPDAALDEPAFATLRRQLPDLPTETVIALHQIQRTFTEKWQELASTGGLFGEARDVHLKEQRAEIARLLSPEELEEFDLRTGNVANNLRNRLVGVDVTEPEFRTLYRMQQMFDDQYGTGITGIDLLGAQRSSILRQRSDAQRQLDEQVKATLGEQRYADYQRARDGNYSNISRLVTRLSLPSETTNQVYAAQQEFLQRSNALQSNRALTPDDRNSELSVLASEAESRITGMLGADGFQAYTLTGGSWLRQLQPRPTNAPSRGGSGGRGVLR